MLKNLFSNIYLLKNYSIFPRVVKGFFRGILLNKPTLKTVEIFPTMKCNSKCIMCSVSKYRIENKNELTIDDCKNISRQAEKLGAIAFSILGGEPTLRPDLEEIIEALNPKKFFIVMVTNSILLTKEKLVNLKKAGLYSICLSLDNLDKEKNDDSRGFKGHFDKVMQTIGWAKEIGLIISISPVAFHNKLDDFERILKFAKKNGFVVGAGGVGYVGKAEEEILLSKDECNQLREFLKKYSFLRFDWSLSYKLKYCCPAGKEKICITSTGDVVGCSMNPISFGNIREEELKTIWKRMNEFPQFKKDFPGCLVAEDIEYINDYMKTIKDYKENPVYFKDHPTAKTPITNNTNCPI